MWNECKKTYIEELELTNNYELHNYLNNNWEYNKYYIPKIFIDVDVKCDYDYGYIIDIYDIERLDYD